jgi:hypothetical protein
MAQDSSFGFANSVEPELRRPLDLAIGRALVDDDFAAELLAEPTVAFGARDGFPERYGELGSIRASSLHDFACQAWKVLWPSSYHSFDALR